MTPRWLRPGAATGIGSLPHIDPEEAAEVSLRLLPELPASPQLPKRSAGEGMLAQAASGVKGVDVRPDGSLSVDVTRLDRAAPIDITFDDGRWLGLLAFLDAAADTDGPVKLQLTGPVTFGLALRSAGAPTGLAFTVADAAVRQRAAALVILARARLPGRPLAVFLDEPGLGTCSHPGYPIPLRTAVDLLGGALAALRPDVVTGVHCCGPADWRLPLAARPDILSAPVGAGLSGASGAVGAFLRAGGWIAWGAVPTGRPVGDDGASLWRRLMAEWCDLARAGCDHLALLRQSLVTPECGLAGHDPAQAEHRLALAVEIGRWVRDQAVASALAAGA